MARVYGRSSSTYAVSLNEIEVARFRDRFPASGLGKLRRARFEFERRSGDLVDAHCNSGSCDKYDGPALLALTKDAQCIAERRLRPRPEHAPRCGGSDWKHLLGGAKATKLATRTPAPESCRANLSKCMKSASSVGAGRKPAASATCMREFNRCRRR